MLLFDVFVNTQAELSSHVPHRAAVLRRALRQPISDATKPAADLRREQRSLLRHRLHRRPGGRGCGEKLDTSSRPGAVSRHRKAEHMPPSG